MSRAIAFVIFFAATLSAAVTGSAQAQSSGSILSGIVRNGWSRAPLRRAIVTLSTNGAEPMDAVTYSDSNGAFAFSGVPPGEYTLCARVRAYERACYGGTFERGRPLTRLFVRPNQNKQDIILAALPLGSVSGVVRDSDGDPVSNAQVRMLQPVYERRVLHWRSVEQAATDNRGEYHMSFVRPGRYRFSAERQYVPATHIQPDVAYGGAKPVEELYKPQFYPNADSVNSAETLTLNAGNEMKAIDFTLSSVERAEVSGRLTLPAGVQAGPGDGENFVPVTLFLISETGTVGDGGDTSSAGAAPPDFAFTFNSVQPGPYRLLALLRVNDKAYFVSQHIEAGSNSQNLTLALEPGSPLSGHLKLEGKGAQEHGPYKIRLTPGDEGRFLGEQPTADVKPDGSFEFDDVLPGIWDIGVDPMPPGSYIKSMLLGKKDVLTDDMTLGTGTREPLDVVLNMDGGIINGTVLDTMVDHASGDTKTASRSVVLLAPFGKFDNVLSFYESRVTDENGHFEFKSVTPGRYKIYAFDRMEPNEYEDPNFLKPYVAMGEAFDVPDGARLDKTAAVIVRGESGSQ